MFFLVNFMVIVGGGFQKQSLKKRKKNKIGAIYFIGAKLRGAWIGEIMSAAKDQPVSFIIKVESTH